MSLRGVLWGIFDIVERNIDVPNSLVGAWGSVVSGNLKMSADIERTSVNGATYGDKLKEFRVRYGGEIRITCEYKSATGTTVYLYFFKNGIPSPSHSAASAATNFSPVTRDFNVSPGDYIQIYGQGWASCAIHVRNARVYYDLTTDASAQVILD